MIATLPMYDWPEIRQATDAWWRCVSNHAGSALQLDRLGDHTAAWSSPDLAFSQTCGYPFTHAFSGKLNYIATPHYAADGCQGASYSSIIFARQQQPLEAFKGSMAAINGWDSMSGMLALKLVFAPLAAKGKFFGRTLVSGAHRESLRLVQQGKADVCAVDSVAVALARRYRPEMLEGLVEVARSPQVPGLPYVTAGSEALRWRAALALAFKDADVAEARDALLLSGFSILADDAYDRILELEKGMEAGGGVELIA
jgi:ABC-type phosphate/phosphonate transport system substrate-binding protein